MSLKIKKLLKDLWYRSKFTMHQRISSRFILKTISITTKSRLWHSVFKLAVFVAGKKWLFSKRNFIFKIS